MPVLTSTERKLLDDACVKGRRASEQAVRAALSSLAIIADRPPAHLGEGDRQLRRGLRAKSRQLGDTGDSLDLLINECAYEQWHRLLFARFLAENSLLIHPEYRAPVTLEDCEDLAESLGEPDGWAVAGRFAAEILPGIFRLDDPCVQLRLAPEGRLELESLVAGLPAEVFIGDDALGWVYQYWQKEQKDAVNDSERKIGGADLGPVTQLFTEHYMVQFLLQNSLGAWWAGRHPNSPLVKEWQYLRFDDSGTPAVGRFDAWPRSAAELTVMDPCCGSGHFLVEAFRMLWRMRAEEEGERPVAAQDSVLQDNLFGLELDPRCVQIAMFALAFQAWKDGGGWRELSAPNVACSGLPVKESIEAWRSLGEGDARLEGALVHLHSLFREADTLGSLISPRTTAERSAAAGQQSIDQVEWGQVVGPLGILAANETDDAALNVLGTNATGMIRAADLLSREYALVATNPPFLGRGSQSPVLQRFIERYHKSGKQDLATAFLHRSSQFAPSGGVAAIVLPQNWLTLKSYEALRQMVLTEWCLKALANLGPGAFNAIAGEVVKPVLVIVQYEDDCEGPALMIDAASRRSPLEKAQALATGSSSQLEPGVHVRNPDARILFEELADHQPLSVVASSYTGTQTGEDTRFKRFFWELTPFEPGWTRIQSAPSSSGPGLGRERMAFWEDGTGVMAHSPGCTVRGRAAWGRWGLIVAKVGSLYWTDYTGELFDDSAIAVIPKRGADLPAITEYVDSPEFRDDIRRIDQKVAVTPGTMVKAPFDADRWRGIAEQTGRVFTPQGGDATQWLFDGRPELASDPLQVGAGRLMGFQWPEQSQPDDLDGLADDDGIVCVPSVRGERTAAERLQELLARAFGGTWSTARTSELLTASGSKKTDLDAWLRDDFFKAHCQVFKNRPFIWQVWDGRKDGFSALVNYHRLDRPTLEKLTYSYLGDWIERQVAGVRDDVAGAEERLAAARTLQQTLELIIEGEPPYDIYVRWKSLAQQPIGWAPDLNDGVRLNIRPFVEADVLRAKFNVKWDKDRGKNPDGSERFNDLHYTLAQKHAARGGGA